MAILNLDLEVKHEPKEKLKVDLIPRTAFYNNLRSELSKEDWDLLRKDCYKQAGYTCEICGGIGHEWPVECHEVWTYTTRKRKNKKYRTQKLAGLKAVCPNCHEVIHLGYTTHAGKFLEAVEHLMKVNDWDHEKVNRHIAMAEAKYRARSLHKWKLNIAWAKKRLKEIKRGIAETPSVD